MCPRNPFRNPGRWAPWLALTLAMVGCEGFREWREKKAREPASTQQVSDAVLPPSLAPGTTPANPPDGGPRKNLELHPAVTRPAGSIASAVLMVNRDFITAEEVLRRIRSPLEATAWTYGADVYRVRAEELISGAVRDLISETLLYQEIAARITEEQNPAVDKAVDKEVRTLATLEAGGSMVLLEKMLAEQGSNLDELKKQLRKQIVTQQYLREKMKPKVIITRDDLWTYYRSHRDQFVQRAKIRLFLIEIDPDQCLPAGTAWDNATEAMRQEARTQAQSRVRAAQSALAKGEDFSRVARDCATGASGRTGGEMGWISRGSYRMKQLEDAAFRLNVGQVSPPIEVDRKTFILKVEDYQPEKTVPFSEAQDTIRETLEKEVYRKLVMDHLNRLWEKSQIGPVDPFLQAVYSRLPAYETLREKKAARQAGR